MSCCWLCSHCGRAHLNPPNSVILEVQQYEVRLVPLPAHGLTQYCWVLLGRTSVQVSITRHLVHSQCNKPISMTPEFGEAKGDVRDLIWGARLVCPCRPI